MILARFLRRKAADPHVPSPPYDAGSGLRTLVEDDRLRIRHRPGGTDTLIVSFTGIGLSLGGIQTDEFVGTVAGHHAVFVSDLERSWYNGKGVYEDVVDSILDVARANSVTRIVTLGNSMGGFGAVLFAKPLGAAAAIAFSPQFSVCPSVLPDETRWREWTSRIGEWRFPSVGSLDQKARYFLFFGGDDKEQMHARRFPVTENTAMFTVRGNHKIARDLKNARLIGPIVDLCVAAEDIASAAKKIEEDLSAAGLSVVAAAPETSTRPAAREA